MIRTSVIKELIYFTSFLPCITMPSSVLWHLLQKTWVWNKLQMRQIYKNRPSKICGTQHLKCLKWYGLLKHNISLQVFKGCIPQFLLDPFLNTLFKIFLWKWISWRDIFDMVIIMNDFIYHIVFRKKILFLSQYFVGQIWSCNSKRLCRYVIIAFDFSGWSLNCWSGFCWSAISREGKVFKV